MSQFFVWSRLGDIGAVATIAAALSFAAVPPGLAQDQSASARLAQGLCETALAGGFPRFDLSELISDAGEEGEALCRCTAQLFADEGEEAHAALRAEMQSGLLRHANFDQHILGNMRQCLEMDEGDDGSSLGEAYVGHVLRCEGVVEGEASIGDLDLNKLRKQMSLIKLTTEKICGCAGDYYLERHDTIMKDIMADTDGSSSYDRHLAQSLSLCLDLKGEWPVKSDPAFDPDIGGEALCNAVLMRSLEPSEFDYDAQKAWEKGAGLQGSDVCDCVGPRSVDRLAEPDAEDLMSIVLQEILSCRQAIWAP